MSINADAAICKHADKPVCDETCACWCDMCQARYEEVWNKCVSEKLLCNDCGMPLEKTAYSLRQYEYMHFYMPCDACKAQYEVLMKKEGLCSVCRCAFLEGHKCGVGAYSSSSTESSMSVNAPAS
jgi:hypothetical protein